MTPCELPLDVLGDDDQFLYEPEPIELRSYQQKLFDLGNPHHGAGGRFDSSDSGGTAVAARINDLVAAQEKIVDEARVASEQATQAAKAAQGTPREGATFSAYLAALRVYQDAQLKRNAIIQREDRALLKTLPVENPSPISVQTDGLDPVTTVSVRAAVELVQRMNGSGVSLVNLQVVGGRELGNAKGQYMPRAKRILLTPQSSMRTVVHELGHAIEGGSPSSRLAARQLLEQTQGTGVSHAYATKVYRNGFTELLSTGLERYVTQPARFAADAPLHFAYVYDVMHGRYAT